MITPLGHEKCIALPVGAIRDRLNLTVSITLKGRSDIGHEAIVLLGTDGHGTESLTRDGLWTVADVHHGFGRQQ